MENKGFQKKVCPACKQHELCQEMIGSNTEEWNPTGKWECDNPDCTYEEQSLPKGLSSEEKLFPELSKEIENITGETVEDLGIQDEIDEAELEEGMTKDDVHPPHPDSVDVGWSK